MVKRKPKTNAQYRKDCVEVAKKIAKHIDGYRCVTCGRTAEAGYQLHGSHILPESRFNRLSVEPENIMCQCARCHMDWHENPKGQDWFDKRYPQRYKKLLKMDVEFRKEITKPDYKKILQELKETYFNLIN